ncbi:MAG TPA: amidohydrolase [Parafilimonas sp.]|nr:amidohydrolase [Parafilimonas sp.]
MAELIVHNAHVITQDIHQPVVQAFTVNEGKIIAVGNNETILALQQSHTKLVNAEGNTVLPGFIDAHIHVWKVGNLKTFLLDLRGVQSMEEMQDKLNDFIKQNPGNGWIQARGFNEAAMKEKRLPTKEDLDKVAAGRPLWIIRTCAHIGVANSMAMELSGIDKSTQVPAGGEMHLDNNGNPNGIFTESALGLIAQHIPPYSKEDYALIIHAAEEELLRYGITSASDPAVMPDLLETYQYLHDNNKLQVRLNAFPIRIPDGGTEILPLPGLYQSSSFNINIAKFFADGGLSGMTAAMSRPYKNSTSTGVLRLKEDFFYPVAKETAGKGFGIATHAIGDAAIDVVLKVYERIRKEYPDTLLRIEHLGLPSFRHLQQMREQNIHCVSQSIFLKELGRNFSLYLEEERLQRIYPYRDVLNANVNLALSSDAPVVNDFNPLTGIRTAMLRKDADGNTIGNDQKLSLHECLHGYTLAAAKTNGNDAFTGSIETGKLADFIVLNKKLDKNNVFDEGLKVDATYIGGLGK